LPETILFGDLAYAARQITTPLKEQNIKPITPKKKAKGKQLTELEKYHNRLVSKCRQRLKAFLIG
jgi:hypothetical protein